MNATLKATILGMAATMVLCLGAVNANAEYLGYGNGDPGNWDYNTEQHGGPCGSGVSHAIDKATGQPVCCSQYNPTSACPLYRASVDTSHIRHYRTPGHEQ